jgi:hypothetical protein
MEEIVITCNACETQRTIGHVEDSALSDIEVIEKAGHTPQCIFKGAMNVRVEREPKPNEPNMSLYVVKEA